MSEPRYTRTAFLTIKIPLLICALIVIWNLAKEAGRQEILNRPMIQAIQNGSPIVIWGESIYPAVAIDKKKMLVKIKELSK